MLPGPGLVIAASMDGGFGVGVIVVEVGGAVDDRPPPRVDGGPVGGQIHGRAGAGEGAGTDGGQIVTAWGVLPVCRI